MEKVNKKQQDRSKAKDIAKSFAAGAGLGTIPLMFAFAHAGRQPEAARNHALDQEAVLIAAPQTRSAATPQNFRIEDYRLAMPQAAASTAAPQIQVAPSIHSQNAQAIDSDATFERFIDHLYEREGRRNVVYNDHLGNPTVGVGHLVLRSDNLRVGDRISDARVRDFLEHDARKAFNAAVEQAREIGIESEDFVIALGSVNFQLGTGWRSKFTRTWQLISEGRYEEAAHRLNNTRWNTQTPTRVQDFQRALRNLSGKGYSFHIENYRGNSMGTAFNGAVLNDPYDTDENTQVSAMDIRSYQRNGANVLRVADNYDLDAA